MSVLEGAPDSATNNINAAVHMDSIYDMFGLAQLIQEPTRVTLDTATLIDHIATSHPETFLNPEFLKLL